MNAEALARTLASGRVTFFSRSRRRLWEKGETSGHTLELRGLAIDCDGDALLAQAAPRGPTCHTGAPSCFFRPVGASETRPQAAGEPVLEGVAGEPPLQPGREPSPPAASAPADARPSAVFERLFTEILGRKAGRGMTNRDGRSYVRDLLAGGVPKIAAKLAEEAGELADALAGDDRPHIAREAADLLFHALVGLAHRDVALTDVAAELERRMGRSGVDEKAARTADR
jgi:phosphoribosyl-ATP pyrophosphohydrolase/phosphoribosyl-AMP cyclohydrolase